MTGPRLTVAARLGADAFVSDKVAHLTLSDPALCRACVLKPCIRVCPAEVYTWDSDGDRLLIHYENCLETGACRPACWRLGNKALLWEYPNGGKGVQFRFG